MLQRLAEGTETIQEIGGAMAESCDGTDLKELLPPLLRSRVAKKGHEKWRYVAWGSMGPGDGEFWRLISIDAGSVVYS